MIYCRVLAGPFATMLLGDLGAEVIKVEKPDGGDDTRSWAPPYCGDQSTYFLSVNRNKKSVAINIKDPKGAELVGKVRQETKVLHCGFSWQKNVMSWWKTMYLEN